MAKQAIRTAKNVDFCEIGLIGQESKKVLGNYQKEVLAFFAEKFGIIFLVDKRYTTNHGEVSVQFLAELSV